MARFGWTEKEVMEGFASAESMELFLDYLGLRDRVLSKKPTPKPQGPQATMQGNILKYRSR